MVSRSRAGNPGGQDPEVDLTIGAAAPRCRQCHWMESRRITPPSPVAATSVGSCGLCGPLTHGDFPATRVHYGGLYLQVQRIDRGRHQGGTGG